MNKRAILLAVVSVINVVVTPIAFALPMEDGGLQYIWRGQYCDDDRHMIVDVYEDSAGTMYRFYRRGSSC